MVSRSNYEGGFFDVFPPLRLREALSLGGLSLRELLVRTWLRVNENEIQTRAAAMSFYAMLALVPFIGLVLTLSVQLLPDLTGRLGQERGVGNLTVSQLRSTLESALPNEASKEIEQQIIAIQQKPPVGLISIGLAITIWLASSLFVAVIDALNRIYGVKERRGFIRLRLTAIIMTIVQATILVGSLVLIVAGPELSRMLGISSGSSAFAIAMQYFVVLMMVLLSFALTYYVAPDADQSWEWITPGSLAGSVLFLISTLLFRLYVQYFGNYGKSYGSLGGVMVLLFWFWISSLVLLSSAQVNKVIEEASPLGKNAGQRTNTPEAPDFKAMRPERADF
ncbi:YihY/virulence factor BrkB family protein [Tundrisphaera lichenicola]|uniref:YihY/virulence factor BrkB family protein n=1 Tax=Tundrisphaera lichenicola TaxID=2029860 RepID=UPI003EC0A4C9